MEDVRAVVAAHPAARDTADHLVLGDLQVQHAVQRDAPLGEDLVQCESLGHVPREAVQQEPAGGVRLGQPVLRHGDGDLVRYELAGVHDALRGKAQLGALTDVGAEQVTGGHVRDGQGLGQQCGLSTLPGPGRSDEDDSHQRRNPS